MVKSYYSGMHFWSHELNPGDWDKSTETFYFWYISNFHRCLYLNLYSNAKLYSQKYMHLALDI